jgi:hypothetical protein
VVSISMMRKSQQAGGTTQLYMDDKSDLDAIPSFLLFLSPWQIRFLAKSAMVWVGKPAHITTLESYPD